MNILDVLRIPPEFGLILLTLSLILFLSPYFSGVDFGVIKIPKLNSKTKKRLKIIGPILFVSAVSLFVPFWPQPDTQDLSQLSIQSLRISQSDTNYRLEIIANNPTIHDELITKIEFFASSDLIPVTGGSSRITFNISDNLIVQQVSNNQAGFSTEMTEGQDAEFSYKVNGFFSTDANDLNILSFSFDTSIHVPRESTVQFDIFLPRDLTITEISTGSSENTDIPTFLEATKDDLLEDYWNIRLSVWCTGATEPIIFVK